MARHRINAALVGLGLITVLLCGVVWVLRGRVAEAQDSGAQWEQRFTRVCRATHTDLGRLKSELPRYAEHVRLTHRPETPNPTGDAMLDAAGIHLGPIYMLVSANLKGLSSTLQHCLREDTDEVGLRLQDLRGAATELDAERLIDELRALLQERYAIPGETADEERVKWPDPDHE